MSGWQRFAAMSMLALGAATPLWGQTDDTASKDVLVFTNGDRLSGKLVRGVKGSLTFHSDLVGDVTVPVDKVQSLQTSGTFAVLRKGVPVKVSQQITPEPIELSSAGVVVAPAAGAPPETVPLNEVVYIVDGSTFEHDLAHKAGLLQGWNGSVTMGATVVQATQHGGTFTAASSLVRQIPVLTYFRARNKTMVNVQETYGTSTTPTISSEGVVTGPDSTVKTSIFHADVERDEYFSPKGYGLVSAAFDHNFSQGLQLQQTYGVGIGYTALATAKQNLELKVDAHYEKQEFFIASENLNLFGSTFAENYRAQLPRKLVLTEAASIIPAWNDLDAYAATGSIGLVMPLLKRLNVSMSATDSFLNNPSMGYMKNSLQFVTGLTYTLR